MIRLYLYGQLKEDYGEFLDFDAKTPREVITALSYQCPKYKQYLEDNYWHVVLGKKENEITPEELDIGLGKYKEVHLLPAIEGEGDVGKVFSTSLHMITAATTAAFKGAQWIAGKLMPKPPEPPKPTAPADKRASFLFTGAVNSTTQGLPIPRGYGRLMIGSSVISASVYAEQLR